MLRICFLVDGYEERTILIFDVVALVGDYMCECVQLRVKFSQIEPNNKFLKISTLFDQLDHWLNYSNSNMTSFVPNKTVSTTWFSESLFVGENQCKNGGRTI